MTSCRSSPRTQNEYVYTHDWRGPFYGGFKSVIETFEMTEEPRRVKPVNIYYHFYSAANLGALRALEKVHQWAMTQPLHATTAAKMAAATRDSHATAIYHNAGGRDWTVINEGRLQTLRIPSSLGLPDMVGSEGLIGYKEDGGQTYIHTDGRPKVRAQARYRTARAVAPASGSQLIGGALLETRTHFRDLHRQRREDRLRRHRRRRAWLALDGVDCWQTQQPRCRRQGRRHQHRRPHRGGSAHLKSLTR